MLSRPRIRVDAKILLGLVVGCPVGGENYATYPGQIVDNWPRLSSVIDLQCCVTDDTRVVRAESSEVSNTCGI